MAVTLAQPPADVLPALLRVLVRRGDLAGDVGERLAEPAPAGPREIGGRSVPLSREELAALVPPESARYITEEGGRYVMTVTLAADGAGTRVEIRPTLIAHGGGGPMGGRPLPSNGTLERQVRDSLVAALARTGR